MVLGLVNGPQQRLLNWKVALYTLKLRFRLISVLQQTSTEHLLGHIHHGSYCLQLARHRPSHKHTPNRQKTKEGVPSIGRKSERTEPENQFK